MAKCCVKNAFGVARWAVQEVGIEGSERDVFTGRPGWISKVDALIIESHDWLKSGCRRSVYEATRDSDDEWQQGENVYIIRNNACIVRK